MENANGGFTMASLFSEEEMGPRVPTPKEIERQKKEEEKKRKEEERRKREEEWKKKLEEEEKKKAPPNDMERIVRVYGEEFRYPAGMPLDEIRKKLVEEHGFIEYSSDNKSAKMEWFVDETEGEKRLIVTPIITYARKGAQT